MATANLGAAAFVYKGNWALGGGTVGTERIKGCTLLDIITLSGWL